MKNKIVIFGGSFNPPLNSHFSIAQQVLNDCEDVEKIIFVPVNQKYFKDGLIENEHRMAMLNLVIQENEGFELSDIDMHSDHSLYMIEIMKVMKEKYPDKKISFMIGTDNFKEVSHWKNAEELLSSFQVVVVERGVDVAKNIVMEDEMLKRHTDNILILTQDLKSNYSSTYVREQIKKGKSIRYLTPEVVYEYIKEHGLYL